MLFRPTLLRPAERVRAWLAALMVFALLGAALAPAISRALNARAPDGHGGAPCHLLADATAPAGKPALPGAHAGDVCAMCVVAHTTPLIDIPVFAVPAGSAVAPPRPLASPASAIATKQARAASARAPPRFG